MLRKISKSVKEIKDNTSKKAELRKRLSDINWEEFGSVHYPMNVNIILKNPLVS